MRIRQANESDVLKVSRLWLEMVQEMKPEYTPNIMWWRQIAHESLKAGHYHILVAEEGGRVEGFVDWFVFPEPSTGKFHAIGQHLFLKPSRRGEGIGRDLYDKAIGWAKDHGIATVDMFCFDKEKPMWEAKGFSPLRSLLRKEI